MKSFIIKEEYEPLTKSKKIYRAYEITGNPLYIGREEEVELRHDLHRLYGKCQIFKSKTVIMKAEGAL